MQAHRGAEIKGHSFLTLAPDKLGCRCHTRAFYILERQPVSTVQQAGWPSGPVSMGMEKPRSDTDSNPETSSPQRDAISNGVRLVTNSS